MCGIAGLIAEKDLVVREALAAMVQAQAHRGPDDEGAAVVPFGDRVLGLGHRRLSIQDLSAAGHQPMADPRTGNQIIFNGEIYNYPALRRELESDGERFAGHSDTEGLLYGLSRHGPEYLKRLHGMFALAFYNAREQTLLLARDPVGIKPLYVGRAPGGEILFASEVRGLLAPGLLERRLDMGGVAGLLAYGAMQHPCTVFRNVRSFPPGCYQLITPTGERQPAAFWSYPEMRDEMGRREAVERVRTYLERSVREHLLSDVPVGVFLSSGLDSTAIAAMAAKHTTGLRSFSVGFGDQGDMSELALARQTAGIYGLEHTEIVVNNEDCEQAAERWLQSLDVPSVDGLNVYIISKVVRQQGIKVALSGQGGDELFGGYPSTFYDVPRLCRLLQRIRWMPERARLAAAAVATVGSSEAVRQKFHDMMRSSGGVVELFLQRRRAMSNARLAELGLDAEALGLDPSFQPREAMANLPAPDADPVWAVSQLDSRFYQGNMLLRDADTNGMAHGLEIRVPMLDQRMLDLMLPLPGRVRLPTDAANKQLLRDAMAPYLRTALLNQTKRGFTLPIRRWMVGPMRSLCENAIRALKSTGALREKGIDAVWQNFLADPESPIWSRAFTLCVLGVYCQRMKVSV